MARVVALGGVYNGGKRGREDYTSYRWSVLLDSREETASSIYGGIKKIFLGVCYIEVELGLLAVYTYITHSIDQA